MSQKACHDAIIVDSSDPIGRKFSRHIPDIFPLTPYCLSLKTY